MRMLKSRGFTLIEVLVVITVIGLLMGLLLPAILRSKDVSNLTRCTNNLKQFGVAFAVYLEEYMYLYPPSTVDSSRYGRKEWMDLIRPRMGLGTLDDGLELLDLYQGASWHLYQQFDCPGNSQSRSGSGRFDYGYNLKCLHDDGTGRNANTVRSDMIVVHCANHYAPTDPTYGVSGRTCNPGIHSGFDNYLFADGHVENSNAFYKKVADKPPWLSLY